MDLKPDNIMLNYDSSGTKMHAVVIDLGLACHFGECEQCGSPGYIAPEVVLDNVRFSSSGRVLGLFWTFGVSECRRVPGKRSSNRFLRALRMFGFLWSSWAFGLLGKVLMLDWSLGVWSQQ